MRKLCEFLFPFLFERNWHTGEQEWSRYRVVLVLCAFVFVVIGILIAAFLQMPVNYRAA